MFFFFVRLPKSATASYHQERYSPNPISKLLRIGYSSRQEDDIDMLGKHDDNFFPNDTTLSH